MSITIRGELHKLVSTTRAVPEHAGVGSCSRPQYLLNTHKLCPKRCYICCHTLSESVTEYKVQLRTLSSRSGNTAREVPCGGLSAPGVEMLKCHRAYTYISSLHCLVCGVQVIFHFQPVTLI